MSDTQTATQYKPIWSSPAGKARLANMLVAMLPEHKTYVEPFAGSAAVFFNKPAAEVEVLNDFDPEIAAAFKTIKGLTGDDLKRLNRFSWIGDRTTFRNLSRRQSPDAISKLYRFLYLANFSFGGFRSRGFSPSQEGIQAKTMVRLERNAQRLKGVHVYSGDYEKVVRKYDSADTLFFFDPPYAGYNANVGEGAFDEQRFMAVLESLKGKFLLTYGTKGELPKLLSKSKFNIKRIRPHRTIRQGIGNRGAKRLTTLVVTNYSPTEAVMKHLAYRGWVVEDWAPTAEESPEVTTPTAPAARPAAVTPPVEQPTAIVPASGAFIKTAPIIKGTDPSDERYVLGVVLEPEVVDSQGDIYSVEEIRQAAHRFMEEFGGIGLMHRFRINDRVRILESYLAPVEFSIGDRLIRQGTWLLAVRVLDDDIWSKVQDGALSGFSIGGSAVRTPETAAQGAAA